MFDWIDREEWWYGSAAFGEVFASGTGEGYSDGIATVTGVGASTAAGAGTAAGTSTATAVAPASAIPTFQAAGTAVESLTTASPAWPTHQTNDIALLLVSTANEAVSFTDAQGFVEIPDSPQSTGTTGAATAIRLSVFWCRATSGSMTAPTLADPGNHQFCQILTFRGCITTGNPYDVTAGDTAASSTSVSIPGDTTTVANTLVVAMVAHSTDTTTPQASSFANADLSDVAEITDVATTFGNGSGFAAAAGGKASAGAYGATTATLATASAQARISIALKPA